MSIDPNSQAISELGSFGTEIITHDPTPLSGEQYRNVIFTEGVYPYSHRVTYEEYTRQKYLLQVELTKLQSWVRSRGERVLVIFEGRDTAGKSATVKRFMEHLNPRGARVVALDKPSETERSQWYFQRHIKHLPSAGEMVFFDRSWYNRAGVERVMNFATEEQCALFFDQVPTFERLLVEEGITLFKFYLSVGQLEQHSRVSSRLTRPLEKWKLSPIDLRANELWAEYTDSKIAMFQLTDTAYAPWTIIKSDDKMRARLNAMSFLLNALPYETKTNEFDLTPDPLIVARASEFYSSTPVETGVELATT